MEMADRTCDKMPEVYSGDRQPHGECGTTLGLEYHTKGK